MTITLFTLEDAILMLGDGTYVAPQVNEHGEWHYAVRYLVDGPRGEQVTAFGPYKPTVAAALLAWANSPQASRYWSSVPNKERISTAEILKAAGRMIVRE